MCIFSIVGQEDGGRPETLPTPEGKSLTCLCLPCKSQPKYKREMKNIVDLFFYYFGFDRTSLCWCCHPPSSIWSFHPSRISGLPPSAYPSPLQVVFVSFYFSPKDSVEKTRCTTDFKLWTSNQTSKLFNFFFSYTRQGLDSKMYAIPYATGVATHLERCGFAYIDG